MRTASRRIRKHDLPISGVLVIDWSPTKQMTGVSHWWFNREEVPDSLLFGCLMYLPARCARFVKRGERASMRTGEKSISLSFFSSPHGPLCLCLILGIQVLCGVLSDTHAICLPGPFQTYGNPCIRQATVRFSFVQVLPIRSSAILRHSHGIWDRHVVV